MLARMADRSAAAPSTFLPNRPGRTSRSRYPGEASEPGPMPAAPPSRAPVTVGESFRESPEKVKDRTDMQQTVVKATLGRPTGSRASRRLRADGQLPGVVYGLGEEPVPVAVDYAELRGVLTGSAGLNAIFTLDLDGTEERVFVRDIQRDPIKRVVTHADFLRIDPDQKIRVSIPIELTGEPTEVLENGGLIEQAMHEIEVEVAPDAIPDVITADVSRLTLDSRIAVADLDLPAGVTSLVEDEISVVVPVISRAAKVGTGEEGEDDELGEVEDGAEGEGSEDGAEGAGQADGAAADEEE